MKNVVLESENSVYKLEIWRYTKNRIMVTVRQKHKKTALPVATAEEQELANAFSMPTGKSHISYSEIMDWHECSFRHSLKHVQKINLDSGSIHTAFGKAIHDAAENFIRHRELPPTSEVFREFRDQLKKLDSSAQEKALKLLPEFKENLPDMISQIPEWVDLKFPGWECVDAEHLLMENIKGQEDVKFKGYIDAIIKVEKKPTKKLLKEYADKGELPPKIYEYNLIDWKTASWGWKADQKRSFEKQMQLILYKHFFAQKMNIPLNQIRCGFVLIKRLPKKDRKPSDRMELVSVSVGPKAIDNALKVLHNMINQVRLGFARKNRKHCKPFCPYAGTSHCP